MPKLLTDTPTFEEARAVHLADERQLRVDLAALLGWLHQREGFEREESALGIALMRLYRDDPESIPGFERIRSGV